MYSTFYNQDCKRNIPLELKGKDIDMKEKIPDESNASYKVTVDGIEFDLVPAPNFSQDKIKQCQRARELISIAPQKLYIYSTALTEDSMEFVKKYTDANKTVSQFIRLVKLWNRMVDLDKYISGRSYIFELIAIHIWESNQNETLSKLFLEFLKQMKSFRSMRVSFKKAPDVPTGDCLNAAIKKANEVRPVILNPSNQAHDLGNEFEEGDVKVFEKKAAEWEIKSGQMGRVEENLICEFVSSWKSVLPEKISLLINRCEWLVDVCLSNEAAYSMRQNKLTENKALPLILFLKKLLEGHPTLENRLKTSSQYMINWSGCSWIMAGAIIAILSGLMSKPIKMEEIKIGDRERYSSSAQLSRFNQCTAYFPLYSGGGAVCATLGFRFA